jgi:hypothetical protein
MLAADAPSASCERTGRASCARTRPCVCTRPRTRRAEDTASCAHLSPVAPHENGPARGARARRPAREVDRLVLWVLEHGGVARVAVGGCEFPDEAAAVRAAKRAPGEVERERLVRPPLRLRARGARTGGIRVFVRRTKGMVVGRQAHRHRRLLLDRRERLLRPIAARARA